MENAFGAPGTGVHQATVFGVAASDLGLTVAAAAAAAWALNISVVVAIVLMLITSYVAHRLAGVRTRGVAAVDAAVKYVQAAACGK